MIYFLLGGFHTLSQRWWGRVFHPSLHPGSSSWGRCWGWHRPGLRERRWCGFSQGFVCDQLQWRPHQAVPCRSRNEGSLGAKRLLGVWVQHPAGAGFVWDLTSSINPDLRPPKPQLSISCQSAFCTSQTSDHATTSSWWSAFWPWPISFSTSSLWFEPNDWT